MAFSDLTTPCFLVDINKVKKNAQTMRDISEKLGISLRPHTKTHKTVEIAELQTGSEKRGITVSTLAEAETYADAGFDDILLAHPVTESKMKRCIDLTTKLEKFIVMISDRTGVSCLQDNEKLLPKGKTWNVVLEIDAGNKRNAKGKVAY